MSTTFPSFVLLKQNRRYAVIAVIAAVVQLFVFKLCYPYADFFSDSYSYIFAAMAGADVNIWPIGYSKFLSLFHHLSYSDTALVAFQYLFGQLTTLYFFFTLLYFYHPGKLVRDVVFIGCFFNPLLLYLSNYVSSDSLFFSLSLWWVIQLLWILHRPRPYQVFVHALLIAALFTLRYNAMFYPAISGIVLIISRQRLVWKLSGIILPLLLIGAFVHHTRNAAYEITGTRQFSIFGGWQLANNALYMYPYITTPGTPPSGCEAFDQVVKQYFSKIPAELKSVSPRDGAFYIKYSSAPLKQYLVTHVRTDQDSTNGIFSWGAVAPVFGSYGKSLIIRHPIAFTQYFLLPNAINYLIPPLEKLQVYNLGQGQVSGWAVRWFHYRDKHVKAISFTIQGAILLLFPGLFLICNFFFIWSLISWIKTRHTRPTDKYFMQTVIVISLLLLANCAFSILASPIVLRYQVFPLLLLFTFSLLLAEKINLFSTPVPHGT